MTESLADRVKRAQAEAEAFAARQRKRAYQSHAAMAARDVAGVTWFLAGLAMGLQWVWAYIVWPVWRRLRKPLWWLVKGYVRLWDSATIARDPYGKPMFSKTRAGLMVAATLAFLLFVLNPLAALAWQAGLYAATAKVNEEVILLSSQEINSDRNVHNIEGCLKLPCSDTDSIYFRVQSSLFNHIWNLAHGKGLFYPDYVAATVASTISRCIITSYGIRSSLIIRNFDVYPEVLEVKSCEVVAGKAQQ